MGLTDHGHYFRVKYMKVVLSLSRVRCLSAMLEENG